MTNEIAISYLMGRARAVEQVMRLIDNGARIVTTTGPVGANEYEFISTGNDQDHTFECGWKSLHKFATEVRFIFKNGELTKISTHYSEPVEITKVNSATVMGYILESEELLEQYNNYNTAF